MALASCGDEVLLAWTGGRASSSHAAVVFPSLEPRLPFTLDDPDSLIAGLAIACDPTHYAGVWREGTETSSVGRFGLVDRATGAPEYLAAPFSGGVDTREVSVAASGLGRYGIAWEEEDGAGDSAVYFAVVYVCDGGG
jgi:hypothetical protein